MWDRAYVFFFFQAEDGIRDVAVTGVQTCALPISFEPEVHGVPVGREPWLEGHLAVPDAESAESADDRLPGSACGGYVDALGGVSLIVEEIDECRPAGGLGGAAGGARPRGPRGGGLRG